MDSITENPSMQRLIIRLQTEVLKLEASNKGLWQEVKLWKLRVDEAADYIDKFEEFEVEVKRLNKIIEQLQAELKQQGKLATLLEAQRIEIKRVKEERDNSRANYRKLRKSIEQALKGGE